MIHARTDYDRIQDPDGKIPADEPVLLIRGQDPLAYVICRTYAEMARLMGCEPHLVEAVERHAKRCAAWPNKKQRADMPADAVRD